MQTNPKPPGRLAWIDQLRTLAIVLVVNMHACVTYSHVGSWYTMEGKDPPLASKVPFVFWQGHLQSFFMGILFLVAGYFAQGSLERRGPAGFVRERLFRLGLPSLLYMLAIHPLIVLVINPGGYDHGPLARAYLDYLSSGRFLVGSGPMWFAVALLGFSCAFAGWRALRPQPAARHAGAGAVPGPSSVAAWALTLVAATFLMRTVQPIDSSVLNMQLCFFPQYVLAFGAGIAAARNAWLQPLARSALARRCGWAALVLGPFLLAAVLVASGVLKGASPSDLKGGWHLASLEFASWEQLVGLGLGLGALAFCSGKLDRSTPLWRWLSDRSFGVYLLHPPLLVLLAIAFRPLEIGAVFKVVLLTGTGLAASLLAADTARRIPGLRAIV
ncbi:MAG TPA: acyltransferase [Opitutaceae bacterium]